MKRLILVGKIELRQGFWILLLLLLLSLLWADGDDPIPAISSDSPSVTYLQERIAEDAETRGVSKVVAMVQYKGYAEKLAKVLSKLTPEQQKVVFSGKPTFAVGSAE